MTWTAETPLYLPPTCPPSLLAAAQRLAGDVEAALGARPPLRPQPAPFGQPAVLLGPDPAYTFAIAPYPPETFVVQSDGDELVITGADGRGTILGCAWAAVLLLGVDPFRGWRPGAGQPRERIEVEMRHEQPRWAELERAWSVPAALASERRDDLVATLLRCGGNGLTVEGGGSPLLAGLGLLPVVMPGQAVTADDLAAGRAPRWW